MFSFKRPPGIVYDGDDEELNDSVRAFVAIDWSAIGRWAWGAFCALARVMGALALVVGVGVAGVGCMRIIWLMGVRSVPALLPHRIEYIIAVGALIGYQIACDGGMIRPPRTVRLLLAAIGVVGAFAFAFFGAGMLLPAFGMPAVP